MMAGPAPMRGGNMFSRFAILAAAVLVSTAAQAETFKPLTGTFTIRWINNDATNPITLKEVNGKITGTYKSDSDKAMCNVTGLREQGGALWQGTIICPSWTIELDGASTPNGRMSAGKYFAYGDAPGAFVMTRGK